MTDEQGMLVGRIYMMPHQPDEYECFIQDNLLGRLRGLMRSAKPCNDEELRALGATMEREIGWYSAAAVTLHFALMRSGEIRIWYADPIEGWSEAHHEYLARQAYFFIKDMAHDHVHHEPASDQITPLRRFHTMTSEARRDGEIAWRRETLWNLSREVEIQSRHDTLDKLREAMGILAYADAFQKSLLTYIRDPEEPEQFVPNKSIHAFDYTHIRASTQIRIEQISAKRTVTGQLLVATIAGATAALSLLSSMVSTNNARIIGGKASGQILSIAFPESWLVHAAANPLIVAFMAGYVLWVSFALAQGDVLLLKPRRRTQFIRGATLSIARLAGWRGSKAQRLIAITYAAIALGISGIGYAMLRFVNGAAFQSALTWIGTLAGLG